jgi:CheY-like chemotaxis protein
MTYGFVKQSNGHIMIYSEPGHGTTVRIYLPRSQAAEEVLAQARAPHIEGGHEAILVVEDDLAVQATAVELLGRLGYQVSAANSADAAMEIIDGGARFDLLFTDVVMPGKLRSPELARRALTRLPHLKVLFTSGYTQNAIVHGGRLDPGVHLLSKPYNREQLATKVRALLSEPGLAAVNSALRVAFVEDNEDFRMLGCELIAMLGHEVSAFGDAETVLGQLAPGSFDVLLTDVGLPGMSGLMLAERAHQLDAQLRIVIASGYGDTLAGTLGFAHRVLTKPFTLEQLEHSLAVPGAST